MTVNMHQFQELKLPDQNENHLQLQEKTLEESSQSLVIPEVNLSFNGHEEPMSNLVTSNKELFPLGSAICNFIDIFSSDASQNPVSLIKVM
jgi:hypothetical protein